VATDSVVRDDTLTVVLADPVDVAHAPVPTNDSERLLFRNLFDRLVRIDCKGEVRRQLAVGWSADSARRTWTFTLRGDSPYGDREEAAAQVVRSWQDRRTAVTAMGIDNASVQDGGRLSVTMREPLDSAPLLFAAPGLTVSHDTDSMPWLVSGAGILRRYGPPALIDFRVELEVDQRDLFDRGADLMVTRDPDLLDYAARRPEFATFPLPWNRTYILLWPANADSIPLRLRGAVRAEARPAEPPFWWDDLAACAERAVSLPRARSSRVVYVDGDDVARGLAERIVALASAGAGLRTAVLQPAEFAASLKGGLDRAYVMALSRQTLTPCLDSDGWPRGATIQPLIDTRAHAIVRRGTRPFTVDWDGIVRLDDARRQE
jgi:hypothetical protein